MSMFLSSIDPLGSLLGLCLLLLGIGLLHAAWQRPQRHWPLISAGWLSIALAYWPWMSAAGFDKGAALASLLPGLLALLVIIFRTDWRGHTKAPVAARAATKAVITSSWQRLALSLTQRILVVGLLSLSAAIGIGLTVYALLDASLVNRVISAALVVLLVWPALMVWSQSRVSLLKPALWFVGISLGGWLFTPAIF